MHQGLFVSCISGYRVVCPRALKNILLHSKRQRIMAYRTCNVAAQSNPILLVLISGQYANACVKMFVSTYILIYTHTYAQQHVWAYATVSITLESIVAQQQRHRCPEQHYCNCIEVWNSRSMVAAPKKKQPCWLFRDAYLSNILDKDKFTWRTCWPGPQH